MRSTELRFFYVCVEYFFRYFPQHSVIRWKFTKSFCVLIEVARFSRFLKIKSNFSCLLMSFDKYINDIFFIVKSYVCIKW